MERSELDLIRNQVFDASPVAIAIIDAQTNHCIDCNTEALRLLQFSSKTEALDRSPIEVSTPLQYDGIPSAEKAAMYIKQALTGENPVFEWRCQRQNGEIWDAEISLLSFTVNDKKLLRFSAKDITEQKSKQKLQFIIQKLLYDLNSCTSLITALDRILETIFQIDNIDSGIFYISDKSANIMLPVTSSGLSEEFVTNCDFGKPGSEVYDLAVKEQSTFCSHESICKDNDLQLQKEGILCYGAIPVIAQGKMIALMCLFSHTGNSIPQSLHYALKSIALIVSGTILRLYSETALQKENTLVDKLLDNLPILFFLYDDNLHLIRWNKLHTELFGYSDDELRGMPIEAWSRSEEGRKIARESINYIKEHRSFSNVEVILYTKDNRPIPFLLYGTILDTDDGIMMLGTGVDITERKKADEALKKSEEKFRAIFNSTYQFTCLLSLDGKVIEANRAALDAFGLHSADVTDRYFWETGFFKDNSSSIDKIKDTIQHFAGDQFIRYEIDLVNTKKDILTIDFSLKPILDQNGNISMLVAEGRDITEIKKTEAMLTKAQKLDSLGILAGGIAHDFNNLLSGIYGYVDLIRETSTDSTIIRYLDSILSTMNRARSLTMQLLTFAKGGVPVKNLTEMIPFIKDAVLFALSGSNISCHFNISADLQTCHIDKNQIGQAIDNLVINAKQAMPTGGTIWISAVNRSFSKDQHKLLNDGEYVEISIRDSGCGIPLDILPNIFDPFFTTKPKGNGLGLATCYSIVSQHNGIIEVESEIGNGSTFRIFLPASGETVHDTNESEALHKGSGTFIIMDDEEVVRFIIQSMLSKMGYNVLCTSDGQEAIDCYTNEVKNGRTVAAMLFDLTVPGRMGGMEAASRIRKIDKNIPIFVASGYADDSLISNPGNSGFNAAISKPFKMSELSHILNMHLNK